MRIDPADESEPLTINEARVEREHAKIMQPENIYLIEEIVETE